MGLYEHPAYNIGIIFYIIAACAPAIAVFILWQKDPDKKGMRYFLKTVFGFNRPAIELSLLVAFLMIRFGIPFLFGDVTFIGDWWQVLVFIPVMLLFGGFEEVGWRGYLQPILEKRFGFVVATTINCAIWIVWHIPLCFIKGTYQYSGSYLWFAISLLGSAFSAAALHKVKGSIVPCILFHAIGNEVNIEQIINWDPDYIIFSANSIAGSVENDPVWSTLSAIKNDHYYEVPWNPYNWIGAPSSLQRHLNLLWYTKTLYPEYATYDLYDEVHEYLNLFYHIDLSKETYDNWTNK